MDETYVKVNGRWAYQYRAVNSRGHCRLYAFPSRYRNAVPVSG
jgi:IS6 family transposase